MSKCKTFLVMLILICMLSIVVKADAINLNDTVGQQLITVLINSTAMLDISTLQTNVIVDNDFEGVAGHLSLTTNQAVQISVYQSDNYQSFNPGENSNNSFNNAVDNFRIRFGEENFLSSPSGVWQNLIPAVGAENAIALTNSLQGLALNDVPIYYDINLNNNAEPGGYQTDVIFILTAIE